MGMSGIQIFKLLPRTNCKDCGYPTCLAFAMQIAAGKEELAKCPHVAEDAKAKLAEDSAPPIRTVVLGAGDNQVKAGGEMVLFRHEKTFFNPTGLGVLLKDDNADEVNEGKLKRIMDLQYIRVGLNLRSELAAVKSTSGDAGKFKALVQMAMDKSDAALILMASDPAVMEAGIEVAKARKPMVYAMDNLDKMAELAKAASLPLAIKGENLEDTAEKAKKLKAAGFNDLVLDTGARTVRQLLDDNINVRRQALMAKNRDLGFPTIALPCEMTDDLMEETLIAGLMIPKYAGYVILSDLQGESLFPLLLERLNIYTDPQRPMKTEQGIYELNNPGPESPVLITCNFSLTYFIVSGELEACRVPCYLLVLDTDGLSVLTAWAAGKFVGDAVGPFVKKCGIEEKVTRKHLILPGATAVISGDVEEELGSDWEVKIGPREAAHLPAFLKQNYT